MTQAVELRRLDAMADAVTKVEELSHVGLALVRLDNGSLNIDVTGDEVGDARKILLEELGRKRRLLELLEQLAVRDNGMFDYLSAPVGELIVR